MLASALWLRDNTPEDTTVAGMNTGLVAYFSERKTVNLDGVVNSDALDAIRERELLVYADGIAPDYLVDYDGYLLGAFRVIWGGDLTTRIEPVRDFEDHGFVPFRVYRYRAP